jgi:outer membrane protein OmpA-like peptidoglycan-associated protein
MRRYLFFILLILPSACFSQNLLLNGDFEEENTCTEYKINCAPEAWVINNDAPEDEYIKEASKCFTGSHCMAIEAGHPVRPYHRTFIRTPVLCRLKKGNTYRLQLMIRSDHFLLDSMGVYFSPIDPLLERKPVHLLGPSVFFGSSNRFENTTNWQKVTVEYKANGTETFVEIANFARSDTRNMHAGPSVKQFFVFVDNVSLIPLDPAEGLCTGWQNLKETVYEQNERHHYLRRMLSYRNSISAEPEEPSFTVAGIDSLVLSDVLFAIDSRELRPESHAVLDSFCNKISGKRIDSLVIEGHTDNTGAIEYNDQLSVGRAGAVAGYLRRCGSFSGASQSIRGWGSHRPIAPNNSPTNRQRNRRVNILVYFREI